jgi:hypothetical protein
MLQKVASLQFWGNKKIKLFQSPPELGDLGGLDQSKRRQRNLFVHGSQNWGLRQNLLNMHLAFGYC